MLKPVAVYPDSNQKERRARHVRSHDAGLARRPIPAIRPRDRFSTTPSAWFGFEQEYFLYKDRCSPRVSLKGGGFPPAPRRILPRASATKTSG